MQLVGWMCLQQDGERKKGPSAQILSKSNTLSCRTSIHSVSSCQFDFAHPHRSVQSAPGFVSCLAQICRVHIVVGSDEVLITFPHLLLKLDWVRTGMTSSNGLGIIALVHTKKGCAI